MKKRECQYYFTAASLSSITMEAKHDGYNEITDDDARLRPSWHPALESHRIVREKSKETLTIQFVT